MRILSHKSPHREGKGREASSTSSLLSSAPCPRLFLVLCRNQKRSCSCSLLVRVLLRLPHLLQLLPSAGRSWLMRCWGCHLINTCPAAAMRAYPLHELSHHSPLSPSVIRGLGCCWRSSLCRDMLMFSLLMLLTYSLWIGGVKCATCVSWLCESLRSARFVGCCSCKIMSWLT